MDTVRQLEFEANEQLELSRTVSSLVFSSSTYIRPLIILGILFLFTKLIFKKVKYREVRSRLRVKNRLTHPFPSS